MRGGFSLAVGAAGMLVLAGCVIVSDPPRSKVAPPPPPPPPAAKPPPPPPPPPPPAPSVKVAPTPTADGPHVTVAGKDFVTVSSPVAFGSGQNGAGTFPGFVYWLPDTTQSIPAFDNMTPAGVVFTRGFAVSANPYAQGFPGLDASRNEMFAIRYEADFAVAAVGEYVFRLTSDDAARVSIDGIQILADDGHHAAHDASGRVRLASGAHHLRLDYFQAKGAVVLSLGVTPPGAAEKPFALAM